MAVEKLTDESARIETNLRAEMIANEKSYEVEKANVINIKRELATEVE